MTYDGKVLALAREAVSQRKVNNAREGNIRRERAFESAPELAVLDAEIRDIMSRTSLDALRSGRGAGQAVRATQARVEGLKQRRSQLLCEAGFPENYLDELVTCPKCRDTGYVLGESCSCLDELYKIEQTRLLTDMLNIGQQCFENFRLDYYEAAPDREKMAKVLNRCKNFAKSFDENSLNLLFIGSAGLGKTFLSASIAKVVSESGFSVVYDTCVSVMEAFETQKFDRYSDEASGSASSIKRYLSCDLLILDDLGTELTTVFTQSALYRLINTRLIDHKKTIISTNLTEDELAQRYAQPIKSRILGEYKIQHFVGRDIREVMLDRQLG
ncbi:MAG: ATP-binding protein [Oscillospiraceae bacterium]|jgi:DNA replication protein DnaC|nr:ATP-binding protein [Oscillospiraceae bacterium]